MRRTETRDRKEEIERKDEGREREIKRKEKRGKEEK